MSVKDRMIGVTCSNALVKLLFTVSGSEVNDTTVLNPGIYIVTVVEEAVKVSVM